MAPEKYPPLFRFERMEGSLRIIFRAAFQDDVQAFCLRRPDPKMRSAFADDFGPNRVAALDVRVSHPTPSTSGSVCGRAGFLFSRSASGITKVLSFMPGIIERYTKWLHTQWPAGTVEKLPVSGPDGVTAQPGVRIAGDLTGIPLLKFSSHTGAQAVRAILKEEGGRTGRPEGGSRKVRDSRSGDHRGGGRRNFGGDRSEKGGTEFRGLRSDGDFFDGRQFPEGQTDLHLPDRDEARRRSAIFRRGEGSAWSRKWKSSGVRPGSK